jgi:hypothetical protein
MYTIHAPLKLGQIDLCASSDVNTQMEVRQRVRQRTAHAAHTVTRLVHARRTHMREAYEVHNRQMISVQTPLKLGDVDLCASSSSSVRTPMAERQFVLSASACAPHSR